MFMNFLLVVFVSLVTKIRFYFLHWDTARSWSLIEINSASIPQFLIVEHSFFSMLSTKKIGFLQYS
jgi:hypothetical protein